MNPAKASGFITIHQGNPPVAVAEFRPGSVQNTPLGLLVLEATNDLNKKLEKLYAVADAPVVEPAPEVPIETPAPEAPAPEPTPDPTPEPPPVPVDLTKESPAPEAPVETPTPAPDAPAPDPVPETPSVESDPTPAS